MKKILLIEDDEFLRTLYLDLLKKTGEDIAFSIDGDEAYKKITEGNWDLILLDVLLPGMNALEILSKIKSENPDKLTQKIVVLSNLTDEIMLQELGKFNFEIVNKSQLNPEEFINKIKSYLL